MSNIWHPWDTLMKELMGKGAQALASLALPGVQIGDALNRELNIKKIKGDYFCNAHLDNLRSSYISSSEERNTRQWIGACGNITVRWISALASPSIPS